MKEEGNKGEAEGKGRSIGVRKVYRKETLTHVQYSSRRGMKG